jgi:hypothetical protein
MKPCPFCGGVDIRTQASSRVNTRCICMTCHAEGPVVWHDEVKGETAHETTMLRAKQAAQFWEKRS